jgi:hypothetical protein
MIPERRITADQIPQEISETLDVGLGFDGIPIHRYAIIDSPTIVNKP